ncbi:unnamed protein product [Linum trigynum]|uniref:S1 motif domain-containing protein n=1 Tax=Linum trigynum TaxID=586398 RepID=A0AAV2DDB9_9ROSI
MLVAYGGGNSLSQRERNEIRSEVDAEFEAGEKMFLGKNKKGKKLRNDQLETQNPPLFGDGVTGKLPRFANKMTTKNISPGMKLWGVVAEVNEKDLVISLPGGLRGLVRNNDALDSILDDEFEESEGCLPSIFHVGQLVSFIVLQLDDDKKGKRKIWLSLCLSLLHKGFSLDAVQEGMVDEERSRVSLGMKNLDTQGDLDRNEDGPIAGGGEDSDSADGSDSNMIIFPGSNVAEKQDAESEDEGEEQAILAAAESMASIGSEP